MAMSAKIGRIGDLYMELVNREMLERLMKTKGASQRQLAAIAGWKSHTYMQRLIRGEVKTLSTDPALRIAHHFGVPVDLLFLTRMDINPGHTGQKNKTKAA
ncbi:helix-turn-helix transcriptional regulator [Nocardia cyriacigeorgica]|uniref:Helix-turn-helix transcriptional regulator n=2 Tax=Nocardia cyriacigeorgica TaxID=135487 RepID=A0A5R8NBC8_9NOCA|nr:helix-turn-helix transcriptional regulator [Nocardia cyriacigeorgica]